MSTDKWLAFSRKRKAARALAAPFDEPNTGWLKAFPFGRYRGRPLNRIPLSYLTWLLDEAKIQGGLRQQVLVELNTRN